jgi:putative component of membrane protein insertase Oxa1/YidC/SpoIIIJ protein YidD
MKKSKNPIVYILIFLIRAFWQKRFGQKYNKEKKILCRFYPTCSEYMVYALKKYGLFRGIAKGHNRIKRCNNSNTDSCVDYP